MGARGGVLEKLAREIVVKRAALVLLVGAAFHVAVARGWLTIDDEQTRVWTERVTDVIGLLLAAAWARGGVTPADPALEPKTHTGARLVAHMRATEHPADGTWSPEVGNP